LVLPLRHIPRTLGTLVSTAATASIIVALTAPNTARAQAQQIPKTESGKPGTASSQPVPPQDRTLQAFLGKIVWDPASRGPLLIVAPEKTRPLRETRRFMEMGDTIPSGIAKRPEPDASGNYRLADLTDYFGRRARTVGKSLTVFAPTTMTLLATHLPKPDPYAGMGANEKLRLFQTTLTESQWRKMGSSDGIGIGDLDRKQRELFLSLLPDPFVVRPTQRDENGERLIYTELGKGSGTSLTSAQRQNVRLSMRRIMDWTFTSNISSGGGTRLGMGQDDGARFEIRGNGFGANFTGSRDKLFGISPTEEVPSHLKPGQLPFDWSALNASVSLEGAATVSDLIKRVTAQTHVELYCDPRYADLKVYTKSNGGSVRAGDVLQALCLAITGTFRKVGASTFVLTDDLEGFGTRHARLQAWASANGALAQQRRDEVQETLANTPVGDYVGWADTDPMHPNDALAQKIEDQRKKTNNPTELANQSLIVPITELPASAQEIVRRQLESRAKMQENEKDNPFFQAHPEANPTLLTDRVAMDVQVRSLFLVPGIGAVSAQGNGYSSDAAQSLTTRSQRRPLSKLPVKPLPLQSIPSVYAVRALLVAVRNEDEAARVVASAKAHGLNQVWIDVPPPMNGTEGDIKAILAAAIRAGRKANIAVGAVVRLLRLPRDKDAPVTLPSDRNILGETTTEFAARRASAPAIVTPFPFPVLTPQQEGDQLRRFGDWLSPDSPLVQAAALKQATKIAQTPGLAGIVLRDTAALGYDDSSFPSPPFDAPDWAEQMGYTETMRLAFLRESGIDPIDLSPLQNAHLNLPFDTGFSSDINLQLPFFPDYGINPESDTVDNQSALERGAKDGVKRWKRFRVTKSDTIVQGAIQVIQNHQPNLPIWVERGRDSNKGSTLAYSFDRPTPAGSQGIVTTSSTSLTSDPTHSPKALIAIRCAPLTDSATTDPMFSAGEDFARRLPAITTRVVPGYDGVVVDLTEIRTLDRALPLLDILQPSPQVSQKG
jgi:hypothetical protein